MLQFINKISYFLKYLLEHFFRYLVIFILLIIIILGFTKFMEIYNVTDSNNNIISQYISIYGISLENFFSIINLFALLLTGLWAMYQYDKNVKIRQQEKASKIMDFFCHNLVNKIGIITAVLDKENNVKEIITSLSKRNKLNFNVYEMSQLLSPDEISNFSNYIMLDSTNELYNEIMEKTYGNKKDFFPKTFSSFIIDTLNELEVICMDISSSAAGSQFIYESLHTLFFKVIQALYIKISSLNTNNVDILFVNIVNVYNFWMIKKYKDIKKYNKIKKRINKIDQKSNKMIQNLLNKKPNRV